MNKQIRHALLGLMFFPGLCLAVGDTQGKIIRVQVVADNLDGSHVITIRFSQEGTDIDKDRFNCIAELGYVKITTAHPQISPMTLALHYSNAMAAIKAQKNLAIDSFNAGENADPCNQGAHTWVVY